jgi:HK97 family phage major capsid protein
MEPDTRVSLTDLATVIDAAVAKALGTTTQSTPLAAPPLITSGETVRKPRSLTEKPHQIGIAAARYIRALAFGRGDHIKAAFFAEKVWNDDLGDQIKTELRSLNTSQLTAGGSLVPEVYAAEIIELLRSRTVVRRAGARTLPMNNGNLTIRKQTAGTSSAYVGEMQDIGVSQPELGQITLVAKKLATIVPITNDLLLFSSGPSADAFVRDDLVIEMALREDRAFIRDDGTQFTPRGLRYWAAPGNIIPTNGTTSAQIEEDFKDLINTLESKDVRMISPVWIMHPSRKNHLLNLRDANGNIIYPEMRTPTPTLYTYPVFTTTSLPSNLGGGTESEIYFVDMADAIIGESTSLEIAVDSSGAYVEGGVMKSAFSRDETMIRAISRHDFAMRHRESVAIISNATWGS